MAILSGLSGLGYKKDRAKRFHTSKFVIRYSIFCGSLFSPTANATRGGACETLPVEVSILIKFSVSMVEPRFTSEPQNNESGD